MRPARPRAVGGRRTPLAEAREACGSGRDGTTALAIAQAARGFGLRVRSYSCELDAFAELRDLKPGTTYHYRLVGVNETGRAEGADATFRTTAPR